MNDINLTFPLSLLPEMKQLTISTNRIVINEIKQIIINVFENNGVVIGDVSHVVTPSVVRFEFKPDKTSKKEIHLCEKALNEALSEFGTIRFITYVQGKDTIAIEISRPDRQPVLLREVLESKGFQESKAELPIAL